MATSDSSSSSVWHHHYSRRPVTRSVRTSSLVWALSEDQRSSQDPDQLKEFRRDFQQRQEKNKILTYNRNKSRMEEWNPPSLANTTIPTDWSKLMDYNAPLCADVVNPFYDEEECTMRIMSTKGIGSSQYCFQAAHQGCSFITFTHTLDQQSLNGSGKFTKILLSQ
ncbi:hypothetical protein BDP27DRAFT_1365569, partial [Rhodocollybia butyracea]